MDLRSCKSRLSSWSSMIVIIIILQLTDVSRGESLADSQFRMFAMIGHTQNVTLPCSVSPATDVVDQMVEWSRPDLNPRFVHVRRSGEDRLVDQNPSFKGRTSVCTDGLKVGDVSLKLSKVRLSDEGTYRCFIPELKRDLSVELVVEADIKISKVSTGMLECKSEGWHPEPEVFWLSEQKLLPAGAKEVFRGPDGLYTLSSRLTLEKGHSNKFTCRVQQKNLHREAKIQVPDDFFMDSSPSARSAIGVLIAVIMFIIIVLFVLIWKCRKNKKGTKKRCEDGESQNGRNDNKCASSKDPEKQSLIKKEGGSETLKNRGQVDVHHAAHVSEQTALSCENEHISISPAQVTQNENQQNDDEPGRDATNDVCRDENTQPADKRPSLTERETHSEPLDDNIEISNQSLMDNSGKQQQLNKGEAVKKDTDEKSTKDETAGQSPSDEERKQNTEGKNNPDVQKEDGDNTGATEKEAAETHQPNPAEQPKEGQNHQEDDSRSKSNSEPPHPENIETKQQPSYSTEQPNIDTKLSGNNSEPNEDSEGGVQPGNSTTSGDATSGQKHQNNHDNGEKTETTNNTKTEPLDTNVTQLNPAEEQTEERHNHQEDNSRSTSNTHSTDQADTEKSPPGNNSETNEGSEGGGQPGSSTRPEDATSGPKEKNNGDDHVTAGQSPSEEEGKLSTEGKNNPDVQKEDGDKTGATDNVTAEALQPNSAEQPEGGQKHQEDDSRSKSNSEPSNPENNGTKQQPSGSTEQPDVKEKLSGNDSETDEGSKGGGQSGSSSTAEDATSGQKEKNNDDDGDKTETTNNTTTASTIKNTSHSDQADRRVTEKGNEPQTDAESSHAGSSGNNEPPNNEENQSGNSSATDEDPVVTDQQQGISTTSSAATSGLKDQKNGAKRETPESDEGSSPKNEAGGGETQTGQGDIEEGSKTEHDAHLEKHDPDQENCTRF